MSLSSNDSTAVLSANTDESAANNQPNNAEIPSAANDNQPKQVPTQNGITKGKSGKKKSQSKSASAAAIAMSVSDSLRNIDPQEMLGKLQPFIEKLLEVYALILPYLVIAQKEWLKVWIVIEPYYERYYSPDMKQIFLGFVLLFFGGQYAMTIACYTAIQLSGWKQLSECYAKIKKNYDSAMDAFDNDPNAKSLIDTDGDGKISMEEKLEFAKKVFKASKEEKFAMLARFRCVFIAVDPSQVMRGLGGFWAVCIAVIATLRSKFAKDVALGVSLGEMLLTSIDKYVKPLVHKQFDEDMKQWADFVLASVFRFIGISLALILARAVSAFHSSVKGGHLLALYVFKFLNNKQLIPANIMKSDQNGMQIESNKFFMFVMYGLAIWGFWTQLQAGFTVNSIILRLLLLPFSMTEGVLTFLAVY